MRPRHALLSLCASIGLLGSSAAHATACPLGVLCDQIVVTLNSTLLADGRWQYDYSVKDTHYPYDPSTNPPPQSVSYLFQELRLPYFGDAEIEDLRIGSAYNGLLSLSIEDQALGKASRSIRVASIGEFVETKAPSQVVSGVNSLLSFTAAYSPTYTAPATLTLFNEPWTEGSVIFLSPHFTSPLGYSTLSAPVGMPASPSAVPEAHAAAFMLAGLLTLAAAGHRGVKGRAAS